jgi:hypothetical protein
MDRKRTDRQWLAPALACLLVGFGACSDDTPTATTPPPATPTTTTTTQPPATVLVQGSEPIPARQVWFIDVTVPRAGRVEVTVDYGSASNQILLWLTDRQCSFTLFDRDDCDYLVKSLEGPKPRTMSASNVQPGTYTLFVANDGPGDETITYRVTVTP